MVPIIAKRKLLGHRILGAKCQVSWPMKLNDNWSLVNRAIIPLIYLDDHCLLNAAGESVLRLSWTSYIELKSRSKRVVGTVPPAHNGNKVILTPAPPVWIG